MDRPAEIADLDFAVHPDEDVLGLDVPVHDVFLVQIFQGCGHLGDVLCGFWFGEALLLTQVFIQFTLAGKFQDQKDAFRVMEVSKEAQDIGMREMRLDFYFSADLLFDFALLEFGFVKHFEGADEAGGFLFGEVDAAKFSFAEGLADFEHA